MTREKTETARRLSIKADDYRSITSRLLKPPLRFIIEAATQPGAKIYSSLRFSNGRRSPLLRHQNGYILLRILYRSQQRLCLIFYPVCYHLSTFLANLSTRLLLLAAENNRSIANPANVEIVTVNTYY